MSKNSVGQAPPADNQGDNTVGQAPPANNQGDNTVGQVPPANNQGHNAVGQVPPADNQGHNAVGQVPPADNQDQRQAKPASPKNKKKSPKPKEKKPKAPQVDIEAARANYPPVIEVKNVWKKYHGPFGGDWVLRDVNFSIPRGVSVGLVGKNGAGKSTLLKLLGGMDAPDKGEIVENCRTSWPIGLTGGFQGSMSGRQNVKFVARIMGGEHNIDEIVAKVQEFAEIGKAFDQPVNTYSSGMRSRVAFGLSLAFEFDVYLSDEATAVGDVTFKAKAKQAFHDRVGKASIIMVSHSVGILEDLCQAGIWLHEGKAYWYDKLDDAIDAYYQSIGKK